MTASLRWIALILLAALLLAGCDNDAPADPDATDPDTTDAMPADTVETNDVDAIESPEAAPDSDAPFERRGLDYVLTETDEQVVDGVGTLGFTLMNRIANIPSHAAGHLISPYSIQLAFAMVLHGAEDETRAEMEEVMGLANLDTEAALGSLSSLSAALEELDEDVTLRMANQIWYDAEAGVRDAFLDTNASHFGMTPEAADFSDQDALADAINAWVSEQTEGRIDDIAQPPFARDLALMLVNALYLDAAWTLPFDDAQTEARRFTRADDSTVSVPMMRFDEQSEADGLDVIGHAQGDDYEAVSLYYGDASFRMTLVQPDADIALIDWLNAMDWATWQDLTASLQNRTRVTLTMPTFEMEYAVEDFGEQMQALGMARAFTRDTAQFNIAEAPMYLAADATRHHTYIRVDETGTEAAAATAVGMGVTSMPRQVDVVLDRPFFYVIHEEDSGLPLFMGTMMDPSEAAVQ